jgi:hypothetical protein
METVIVAIIVALAAAWAGWRLLGRRRASTTGCATGCGGCSCSAKPPAGAEQPPAHDLVTLDRRR